MIVGGYAIQFWLLILWAIATCLQTAIKRHDQGFTRTRRKIPNLVQSVAWITIYGCLIAISYWVQWYSGIILWIIGFIAASTGISELIGSVFLLAFPEDKDWQAPDLPSERP